MYSVSSGMRTNSGVIINLNPLILYKNQKRNAIKKMKIQKKKYGTV